MLRKTAGLISVLVLILISGCGPKLPEFIPITPAKETLGQSIAALTARAERISQMQIIGKCLWQFKSETEKDKKEQFNIRMWLSPPEMIRIQGDIAFNSKGLIVGSNEQQFWLAIKPEVDSFWYGNFSELSDDQRLILSPRIILEAIGLVDIEDQALWSLSRAGNYDVLTRRSAAGQLVQKIYMAGPQYRIARIEYFDRRQVNIMTVEMENYKGVSEDFSIPYLIQTTSYNSDGSTNSFRITLKSANEKQFSQKQTEALFSLPSFAGYENVYMLADGNIIELQK